MAGTAEPEPARVDALAGVDSLARADELARRILASAKYRCLDAGMVRRVAGEAVTRFRDRGQATTYARRKLHQAFGAFRHGTAAGNAAGTAASAVAGVVAAVGSGRAELRDAAAAAMRAHASSNERVAWLEPFYAQVARWCGAPASVLDLACGLNPLAIPWMRLAPDASYWACEVDVDLVAALARLDEVMAVRLTATIRDLVASPPALRADVALMLKTVPTLEQQGAGAASRVLSTLDCDHVVVSLPRRSLSRRRGYSDDARATVQRVAAGTRYELSDVAVVGDETLCHLLPVPAGRSF